MTRVSKSLLSLIACWLVTEPALAVEFDAAGYLGFGYSDNVTRVATDQIEDTIQSIGLSVSTSGSSNRYLFDLRGDGRYDHYVDGTFSDDVVGSLFGDLDLFLVRERFHWLTDVSWGQQVANILQPLTPSNLANIYIFSTGPDITLPFGSRTSFVVEGRFDTIRREETVDNDRITGLVSLRRESNSNRTLSINYDVESNEYDTLTSVFDYDRQEVFLRWEERTGTAVFSLDAGAAELDLSLDKSSSPIVRAEYSKTVSPFTILSLSAGRTFSDTASQFRSVREIDAPNPDFGNIGQNFDPFLTHYARFSMNLSRPRTIFRMTFFWRTEEHEIAILQDRTVTGIQLGASRQLRPKWRLGFDGLFTNRDFENLDREDRDSSIAIELSRELTNKLALSVRASQIDRDSNAVGANYTDKRVFLILSYGQLAQNVR